MSKLHPHNFIYIHYAIPPVTGDKLKADLLAAVREEQKRHLRIGKAEPGRSENQIGTEGLIKVLATPEWKEALPLGVKTSVIAVLNAKQARAIVHQKGWWPEPQI